MLLFWRFSLSWSPLYGFSEVCNLCFLLITWYIIHLFITWYNIHTVSRVSKHDDMLKGGQCRVTDHTAIFYRGGDPPFYVMNGLCSNIVRTNPWKEKDEGKLMASFI